LLISANALLTGCLFPSFVGMGDDSGAKGEALTERRDAAPAAEVKAGAVGQASTVGAAHDASAATAAPPRVLLARTLACGSASCPASSSYCCAEMLAPSCRASEEAPTGCLGVLHCTSSQDCNSGEVCCGNPISNQASCRAACGDVESVVCDAQAPQCPMDRPRCRPAREFGGGLTMFLCR
jgi:hypothetical protein